MHFSKSLRGHQLVIWSHFLGVNRRPPCWKMLRRRQKNENLPLAMTDQIVEPEIAFGFWRAPVAAGQEAAEPTPGGTIRREADDFQTALFNRLFRRPGQRAGAYSPQGSAWNSMRSEWVRARPGDRRDDAERRPVPKSISTIIQSVLQHQTAARDVFEAELLGGLMRADDARHRVAVANGERLIAQLGGGDGQLFGPRCAAQKTEIARRDEFRVSRHGNNPCMNQRWSSLWP